jgi:UDP-N-acetyl-2-amino-2-deoxyglucuronate dehydrogenase
VPKLLAPISFALVGAGHIGQRHAAQIARCGRLTAVADILPERAHQLAAEYKARAYPSLEALLHTEQPAVVVICTPNYLHAPQTLLSLEAGAHVLCEKPMCLTTTEAGAMINAAEKAGRHLFIVKQNRFNPPVRLLHQMITEGRLGRLHSFQVNAIWNRPPDYYRNSPWHGQKAKDGGILFTQFSHFIDLLPWLFGPLATVDAYRDNYSLPRLLEAEDTGVAILRMTSGVIGTLLYTVSAYSANVEGSLLVLGEHGTIRIGGQYLNELDYFRVEGMETPSLPLGRPSNDYGFYQGSMSNHDKVYDELIKALAEQPFDLPSATEAARTVTIIEKILAANPDPDKPATPANPDPGL